MRKFTIGRQDTGGLSRGPDPRKGLNHDRLYRSRFGLADIAHVRGQIRWPDKDAIDTFNRQYLVQRIDALAAFDLHKQTHLLVCRVQIVGDATIVRCPCQGRADTARPSGG